MSTFKDYLTEAVKSYDYKIKIAGASKDIDKNALETALAKFDLAKMSAGKTTPIMTLPLDFPNLSNESVTIFDVSTNYPESPRVMHEYLSDLLRIPMTHMVVRKPGEPTEEYQEQMAVAGKSEYKNKLQDIEMSDAPKVNAEDFHSTKANMSLLKELLKNTKNIAIVGASSNPERDSFKVMKFLLDQGYKIFPVNPKEKDILGIRCYPSLTSIKERVDMVDMFRAKEFIFDLTKEAIEINTNVIWMQEGIIDEKSSSLGISNGIRMVMDKCHKKVLES